MHKRIAFRSMDHSDVMEQYVNEQLAKIETFLENERSPVYIDVIFEPSKVREHHRVEVRVKSPNYNLVSSYEHQGDKFYDTIDRVIDVMYRNLHEEKERIKKDDRKMIGRHEEFKKQR